MRKTKITCFGYKNYNDIYISNALFSMHGLISVLDIFPDKKVIVLIESGENSGSILSLISESIRTDVIIFHTQTSSIILVCNKTELFCLINKVKIADFDGLFVASMNKDIVLDQFIHSLEYMASSMVKNEISDISLSINFLENEMVVSLNKTKYKVKSIKDIISSIFAD